MDSKAILINKKKINELAIQHNKLTTLVACLLNEINYKLLYIINEKLNHFQDRIPKDDIQAFKIINDLVYKNEFENVDAPETLKMSDMKKYSNDMIKKMIQSKYLSRKDTIDIMKLIFKESWTKAY